jgi:hypothetical protein
MFTLADVIVIVTDRFILTRVLNIAPTFYILIPIRRSYVKALVTSYIKREIRLISVTHRHNAWYIIFV